MVRKRKWELERELQRCRAESRDLTIRADKFKWELDQTKDELFRVRMKYEQELVRHASTQEELDKAQAIIAKLTES